MTIPTIEWMLCPAPEPLQTRYELANLVGSVHQSEKDSAKTPAPSLLLVHYLYSTILQWHQLVFDPILKIGHHDALIA